MRQYCTFEALNVELPKRYHLNGFLELEPDQISKELLSVILRPRANKVAIISHFHQWRAVL